jgi:hypothetical protein
MRILRLACGNRLAHAQIRKPPQPVRAIVGKDRDQLGERLGTPLSSASQRSGEKIDHGESMTVGLPEIHVNDPATSELNADSRARPAVVKALAKVRMATDSSSARTAVVPPPTTKMRPRHVAQRSRHEDLVGSSRPPQQSSASRTDSNLIQRVWTGLTAAIEQVWPTLPANGAPSARGGKASMRGTLS